MLTPNILERASAAFRRGYADGFKSIPSRAAEYGPNSFSLTDYECGYEAGHNDAHWQRLDDAYAAEMYAEADAIQYGTR